MLVIYPATVLGINAIFSFILFQNDRLMSKPFEGSMLFTFQVPMLPAKVFVSDLLL